MAGAREDGGEHLRQEVGAAGVLVHPEDRAGDHVAVVGERCEDAAELGVDLLVDLGQGRVSPEPVAGQVRGREDDPGEVERVRPQAARPPGRRPGGAPAGSARAGGAARAGSGRRRPRSRRAAGRGGAAASRSPPSGTAQRSSTTRSRIPQPQKSSPCGVGGTVALVGVDRERAAAGAAEAVPDRRRGVEAARPAAPAGRRLPTGRGRRARGRRPRRRGRGPGRRWRGSARPGSRGRGAFPAPAAPPGLAAGLRLPAAPAARRWRRRTG